jgi:hypothetical protein
MSPKIRTPRSRAYARSACHSRSKRTWSSSEPSQSSIQYPFASRKADASLWVTRAPGRARSAGEPAKADGDMYGEPVIPSGGPSGKTCHQDWPAAASQSTNR